MGLGEKTVSRVYTCMSLQDYGGSGDMLVLYSPDHPFLFGGGSGNETRTAKIWMQYSASHACTAALLVLKWPQKQFSSI